MTFDEIVHLFHNLHSKQGTGTTLHHMHWDGLTGTINLNLGSPITSCLIPFACWAFLQGSCTARIDSTMKAPSNLVACTPFLSKQLRRETALVVCWLRRHTHWVHSRVPVSGTILPSSVASIGSDMHKCQVSLRIFFKLGIWLDLFPLSSLSIKASLLLILSEWSNEDNSYGLMYATTVKKAHHEMHWSCFHIFVYLVVHISDNVLLWSQKSWQVAKRRQCLVGLNTWVARGTYTPDSTQRYI